jgi:phage shock protein PspC (stress-responsive transcriptional regulator)
MKISRINNMKRLTRPKNNKVIAGVCAGIANYFNVDPVLVRIIWLVLLLFFGIGLFAYLLLWVVMPEK